ncbi:LAQU0S11e02520g1_1 [Lachancea quebecensis]|uniref:Glutaredoxin-like protein n=1 Tax=Lachancea quebecensis TaxID=1654605 RepID=A0A0N7MM00_9SACH|nr:LAQU0S11e02520g1_1 [Lachancea quebecensis]
MLFIRRFHAATALGNYAHVNLTLFSKANCGLCDKAKSVLSQVLTEKPYADVKVKVVDIDEPQNKDWWTKYCLDVPVLHIENTKSPGSISKIFHKLDPNTVKDQVRGSQ